MTDTHTLTGLPATVRDLTLDVTGLAQHFTLAMSLPVPEVTEAGSPFLAVHVLRDCYIEAWETLTGLSGDAALEVAQAITRHPLPVTAAVCPF